MNISTKIKTRKNTSSYEGLLTARSYDGKESSKFDGHSVLYGGGGVLSSCEDCCIGLTIGTFC